MYMCVVGVWLYKAQVCTAYLTNQYIPILAYHTHAHRRELIQYLELLPQAG